MESITGIVHSSDSIILKEIIALIGNWNCEGGLKKAMQTIVSSLGKVVVIFMIQYYLKNMDKLPSTIFSIFKTLFYRKMRLDMTQRSSELYLARKFDLLAGNGKNFVNNCFPLIFYDNKGCGVIEYLPFVHTSFIEKEREFSEKDFDESKIPLGIKTCCQTLEKETIVPKKLFPSRNYAKLDNVVESYFEVSELMEIYATKGILIDGEPGLGKTGSVEYLASLNKYGNVVKVDMTTKLDVEFSRIVKSVKQKKNETLIVLFDELDKYLSYVIKKDYESLFKNPKRKHIQNWSSYVTSRKEKFLFELLGLLENSYFDKGAVFIFCSNNFETIFHGVDPTHFDSFKKRFLSINFHRCEKEELKEYLKYYNDKLKGSKWYREFEELENELNKLRDDISITYRDISDINIISCYEVEKFIENINRWQEEYNLKLDRESRFDKNELFSTPPCFEKCENWDLSSLILDDCEEDEDFADDYTEGCDRGGEDDSGEDDSGEDDYGEDDYGEDDTVKTESRVEVKPLPDKVIFPKGKNSISDKEIEEVGKIVGGFLKETDKTLGLRNKANLALRLLETLAKPEGILYLKNKGGNLMIKTTLNKIEELEHNFRDKRLKDFKIRFEDMSAILKNEFSEY